MTMKKCLFSSLLAASQKRHCGIPLEQVKQDARRAAALPFEAAVAVDQQSCVVARRRGKLLDLLGRRQAELSFAGLPRAENLAGAAQPQVLLRDPEAVIGLAHQAQSGAGGLAQRIPAKQEADRPPLPSPYPA